MFSATAWSHSANLYRLVGDHAQMTTSIHQLRELESYEAWQHWLSPIDFYWNLRILAALMEDDLPEAIIYYKQVAALASYKHPARPWASRLVEALIKADANSVRAIGTELHTLLIRYHGKPWDTSYLNLWDWYEFTDQIADQLDTQH